MIEALLHVSFSEFVNLSLKALRNIIPHMEQGKRSDEACQLAGYQQQNAMAKQRTLPPISKDDIRNPVVFRTLNQVRKVVNAIVREYGSPMSVHIELGRNLF